MNRSLSPKEDACARRLWSEARFAGDFHAAPIAGGANNRVYRLSCGQQSALLKAYYTGADDSRDRLGAEVAFTRFLDSHGVTAAPRPLAWDRERGMAIFEFIEGRRLTPGEVTKSHVLAALEFIMLINEHRNDPEAAELPPASEACFSIAEHLACVERRVERLSTIGDAAEVDREARRFVISKLTPAWEQVRCRAREAQDAAGVADQLLAASDRCLSPSDFGFHNALLDAAGRLRFFDFEYAGWDDPAKTACDFFCQVELPAPPDCFELFATRVAPLTSDPAATLRRTHLLLPVYRVKWCCILLNEFLPRESRRRIFARGDGEDRKAHQLVKSREMFKQLSVRAA